MRNPSKKIAGLPFFGGQFTNPGACRFRPALSLFRASDAAMESCDAVKLMDDRKVQEEGTYLCIKSAKLGGITVERNDFPP